MLKLLSTPETASPLVYQRGELLHVSMQEKAFRPASSASTARME